jgi:hypothetical protein
LNKPIATVLMLAAFACSRSDNDQQTAEVPTHLTPPPPDAAVGAPKLLPIDEADASFNAFRTPLLEALNRRDTTYLYSILAPEIRNSFGGDDALEGFKRIWNPGAPDSRVWTALTRVLQMGGKLTDSTYTAPYVFATWPDSIDAFSYVAVTNNAAPVRATPSDTSAVAGTASYSILKLSDWKNPGDSGVATDSTWALVQLPDGRSMWLEGSEVYSPVGWRAIFMKRNGAWQLLTFVAGD